jgi:hypothetical protein
VRAAAKGYNLRESSGFQFRVGRWDFRAMTLFKPTAI